MNARAIPEWLAPYKNDWRSAGKIKELVTVEGRLFGPWFEQIKNRLKRVEVPTLTNIGTCYKYQVKQVWAFSLAHGIKLKPNVLTAPPPTNSELLDEISNLHVRLRYEQNTFRRIEVDKTPEYTGLMRMLIAATEPKPAPGVYFLLDDFGHINYVGQSKNVLARMAGHTGKTFSTVKMIKVVDDKERLEIEGHFIGIFQPSANSQGIRVLRLESA